MEAVKEKNNIETLEQAAMLPGLLADHQIRHLAQTLYTVRRVSGSAR